MNRILIMLLALNVLVCKSYAQTDNRVGYSIEAGISSSYIWRGVNISGASTQIAGDINRGRFNLGVFSNISFCDYQELDFILSYKSNSFSFSLGDFWNRDRLNNNKYFTLKNHLLEAEFLYTPKYLPLTLSWNTVVGGDDFSLSGERLFSTYVELEYCISLSYFNMEYSIGFTPWKNSILETEKFGITNIRGCLNKELAIQKLKFNLNLECIANPYTAKYFGVISINIIWSVRSEK